MKKEFNLTHIEVNIPDDIPFIRQMVAASLPGIIFTDGEFKAVLDTWMWKHPGVINVKDLLVHILKTYWMGSEWSTIELSLKDATDYDHR